MIIKPNKAFNDLPLLPPKESLVETISILKQESKSAVALAELKGLTNTLPNPNILINVVILIASDIFFTSSKLNKKYNS